MSSLIEDRVLFLRIDSNSSRRQLLYFTDSEMYIFHTNISETETVLRSKVLYGFIGNFFFFSGI